MSDHESSTISKSGRGLSAKHVVLIAAVVGGSIVLAGYVMIPRGAFWSDLFANLLSDLFVGLVLATGIGLFVTRHLDAQSRRREWMAALQLVRLELGKNALRLQQITDGIDDVPESIRTGKTDEKTVDAVKVTLSKMAEGITFAHEAHLGLANFEDVGLTETILQAYSDLFDFRLALQMEPPVLDESLRSFVETGKKHRAFCLDAVQRIETELASLL